MAKYSTKGTVLQRDIATVYTAFAQIISLNWPSSEVGYYDGTALDSGVDEEDGELTGHTKPGEIDGECFCDPADSVQALMFADLRAPAYWDGKLIAPDSGTSEFTFNGSTKTFRPKAGLRDGFKADFSIKLRSLASNPA